MLVYYSIHEGLLYIRPKGLYFWFPKMPMVGNYYETDVTLIIREVTMGSLATQEFCHER